MNKLKNNNSYKINNNKKVIKILNMKIISKLIQRKNNSSKIKNSKYLNNSNNRNNKSKIKILIRFQNNNKKIIK